MKEADLHSGIESALMILQHRLKELPDIKAIQVITKFGNLPLIKCYPGPINQVFMNVLSNAIDPLEKKLQQYPDFTPQIQIGTEIKEVRGAGTGLGLSISHKIIVKKQGGIINYNSQVNRRVKFLIKLPLKPT